MKFKCFVCGEIVEIEDSYKSRALCQCGADYKREIGGKQIWREKMKVLGEDFYIAEVVESRNSEDIIL